MPDLENPKAQGTLMQPVFFQTGQSLEIGATDMQRRKALADWAQLPGSDVSFSEGLIYSGPACPHVLPPEVDPDLVCGGGPPEADGHSALFFIETTSEPALASPRGQTT